MELADAQRSFAVLIGASAYESASLDDLPAVANNVTKLAELLRDPSVWGLPADRCLVVPEPRSPGEVLDAVHTAARRAEDTLLVYYAGHGLTQQDHDGLLLTLAATDPERPYTAANFDDLRRQVLGARRDVHRIVILDCCYSGLAFSGGMSTSSVEMAEKARIAGSYLLTACAATREAQAPPGETYTAFTGELIRLLEAGLPGGEAYIETGRIYDHLLAELRAKDRPRPQQRLSNTGRTLAFARNRYVGASVPAPVPAKPLAFGAPDEPVGVGGPAVSGYARPPEDVRRLLRRRPRDILARIAELEAAGDLATADGLLGYAAASRPVQEVATLVSLLASDHAEGKRFLAEREVLARGPQAVADYAEALYAAGLTDAAVNEMFQLVGARGAAETVAGVLKLLASGGRRVELDIVLSAAIRRCRTTEGVIDLAGALWSAELDEYAARLLGSAVTNSDEEAVRLGDALLGIGRRTEAFAVYVTAADVLARRPAAELARVVRVMDDAGNQKTASTLLRKAVDSLVFGPPEQALADLAVVRIADSLALGNLCEALWEGGMDARAHTVLWLAATRLAPSDVIALAEALREHDRDEVLVDLFERSMHARAADAEEAARLVDALREMGRPVDANRLLARAAKLPMPVVVALLAWCDDQGATRDRERLLAAVAELPFATRLAVLDIPGAGERQRGAVLDQLTGIGTEEFLPALLDLRHSGRHAALVALLTHLVSTDRARCLPMAEELERSSMLLESVVLRALLAHAEGGGHRPVDHADTKLPVVVATWSDPFPLRVYAIAALCAAGSQRDVVKALLRTNAQRTDRFMEFVLALHEQSLPECVRAVLRSSAWQQPETLENIIERLVAADARGVAFVALMEFAARLGPERVASLNLKHHLRPPGSRPSGAPRRRTP